MDLSRLTASRTTVLETPNCADIWVSVGSLALAGSAPSSMRLSNCAAT